MVGLIEAVSVSQAVLDLTDKVLSPLHVQSLILLLVVILLKCLKACLKLIKIILCYQIHWQLVMVQLSVKQENVSIVATSQHDRVQGFHNCLLLADMSLGQLKLKI